MERRSGSAWLTWARSRTWGSPSELVRDRSGTGPAAPGWIFIPAWCDPGAVLDLLTWLAERPGPWSPLLVLEREAGLDLVPLSPGFPYSSEQVSGRLERRGKEGPARLSFRLALEEASRVRHDINNPLTAAMAEVQLLLMDLEPDSEVGSAIRLIEDQLRRIRDLVAELPEHRPPSP